MTNTYVHAISGASGGGGGSTTLTGDVTGSGTGTVATTIAANAVTYSKIQTVAATKLLGNATGSTANVEEITLGTGLSFSGSVLNASAGGATTLTGDVTGSGTGSFATSLAATTNATLTTLSSLSLPGSQVSGNITGNSANITGTSNSTLTTLSALSLPTSQLSGQTTLSQLPTIAADTFLGNGTGSSATPTALTASQVNALLPVFVGDSGSGGIQGVVPAPPAYSNISGNFLSANGSFSFVNQSKTINPSFSLITQGAVPAGSPGTIKYESTTIFTSITTNKKYAVGVGFIGSPTLTIWDISNQTNPVLTGTFVAAGGGAYNCTIGVVSGVQYAFVGYNSGSHFVVVNLTNPALPVQTSNTVITGSPGSIYGVSFLNGYVYCATQNTGLVVMDVGGGTGTPAIPVQTYQQAGGVKSFGVVAIGTNVYTTSFSTSSPFTIRQIDSWTLTSPGTLSVPSLLQSLQVTAAGEALGLSISGNTAFVTTAATSAYNINLVDITTPSSMTNLSQINSTNAFGSAFYAVANGNYLYIPSGGNVTYGGAIDAYDITNRSAPVHIAQVTTGNASTAFGGIALSGGYIFCADYGVPASNNGYFDVFSEIILNPIFGGGTGSELALQSLTANTALTSNGSNQIVSSTTTATELGYVHGVTSAIQTQINNLGATGIAYTPGTPANWGTVPTTVQQALDLIAAHLSPV